MTLSSELLLRPGPPRPSRARRPEGFGGPPWIERTVVPGAGAATVEIRTGDRIEITNDEGGQRGELLAAHPDGRLDPELLGVVADTPADGLRALLASGEPSLARLRAGLARRGIGLAGARALGLFGAASGAGDRFETVARGAGLLILAAPGGAMDVERQDTATALTLRITRAVPREAGCFALPDPLADPILDLRVKSATAEAYVVRAGEFIQIMDVDGRQCTDFQCFDARKLDRGIVHPLDVTATRTLLGHAYPMPGLHAKYYDQDMKPLVEVIQDTCGRHDAFAMACAAKYYDDIGYPGHANCSDNFNAALAPHGVEERPGWMAANFFFNTGIDAHGVMYTDEPWSRPGDYVLLRALTDIVCVSSACPDDTSPANGWTLTDIHVRGYAATQKFQRATAWRATPDAEPVMTRETAFHSDIAELTRDFVEYRGFWLPNAFPGTDPVESYWACREGVVFMDLSALRKFEVTGPDSEALLNWVLTRDVEKLGVGQVVYSAMCHPHGGMIDDGTLFRLGPSNFRWIGGSDEGGAWMREQAAALGLNVLIRSSTDQMHNLAVQGPKSRALMSEIIWTPPHQPAIGELGWFRFTVARIGGPAGAPVVVSRTGYTGELGYEIFCHPKHGAEVFAAVQAAGKPLGLRPMGLAGLDLVRIEAGLVFAGYDFSDETDPFEAGVGFTVPLKSKAADFVGRAALRRRKDHPSRRFVGLEIDGQEPVGHGDCARVGRARVGEICSAMRSPRTGRMIALARLDVAHADAGTAIEIGRLDGHIKRIAARVVPFPHYDPKKERPRS
jgi:aminomethyltransferase